MKACLLKVNYDPKFTAPHSLKNHLDLTNEIYNQSNKQLRKSIEEASAQIRKHKLSATKNILEINTPNKHQSINFNNDYSGKQAKIKLPHASKDKSSLDHNDNSLKTQSKTHFEQHKQGIANAHSKIRQRPSKIFPPVSNMQGSKNVPMSFETRNSKITSNENKSKTNINPGPYAEKFFRAPSQIPSQLVQGRNKTNLSFAPNNSKSESGKDFLRSQTTCAASAPSNSKETNQKRSPRLIKLERRARREAERAIKDGKVFTIMGPYPSLRGALRKRGWVEKFPNIPSTRELIEQRNKNKGHLSDGDEDDGDTKISNLKPWEEDGGFYGLMSHSVKNAAPSFLFSVKSVDVHQRVTKDTSVVNHFGKAGMFTTKTGLSQNIRNVTWFYTADADCFFPRCYKLNDVAEKEAFLDDYRSTCCIGLLRCFVVKYKHLLNNTKMSEDGSIEKHSASDLCNSGDFENSDSLSLLPEIQKSDEEEIRSTSAIKNRDIGASPEGNRSERKNSSRFSNVSTLPDINQNTFKTPEHVRKGGPRVTVKAFNVALHQVQNLLRIKQHEDIDLDTDRDFILSNTQWDQFINWYYSFVHDGGDINGVDQDMVKTATELIDSIKDYLPQYSMDGYQNVWILKPGAKSRGRGITCKDRLDEIMNYLEENDSIVIQKYIERPLLVYNTKFDIRQWFLVTDWNPLTIWFYNENYLRFCSREFTLDDFHEAIHLSNNSIQKYYDIEKERSSQLPDDNMWTGSEFSNFLRQHGKGNIWEETVIQGIKEAIICVMLCSQEHIEARKGAFELYGADFMVDEDLNPWLIEINSSPSMARNTRVTNLLVDRVMEDTVKVVLDRKYDKNADTGSFELIYKQTSPIGDIVTTDQSLTIEGKPIKKKLHIRREKSKSASKNL